MPEAAEKPSWLNRTVLGVGLTSLFSDWSHETATAVLPAFLAAIGWGLYRRTGAPVWSDPVAGQIITGLGIGIVIVAFCMWFLWKATGIDTLNYSKLRE